MGADVSVYVPARLDLAWSAAALLAVVAVATGWWTVADGRWAEAGLVAVIGLGLAWPLAAVTARSLAEPRTVTGELQARLTPWAAGTVALRTALLVGLGAVGASIWGRWISLGGLLGLGLGHLLARARLADPDLAVPERGLFGDPVRVDAPATES